MDMKNPIFKVGIVGSGEMAEVHLNAICEVRGLQLAAIYSSNKERAQYLSKKYGDVQIADSFDNLVKKCDIVDIVTKNYTHLDYAKKALAENKHIIIEKPVDINVEKAIWFMEQAKNSFSKITVISQNRFNENIGVLIKDKEKGRFGDIFHVRLTMMWKRGEDYYESNSRWRNKIEEVGGGVALHQGIHLIDLLLWIFGDIKTIYSFTKNLRRNIKVEDLAVASILMENGILVNLSFSTNASCNFPFVIEVFGTLGTGIISGDSRYEFISKDKCKSFSFLKKLFYKMRLDFNCSFSKRMKAGAIRDQLEQFYDDIVYDQNKTLNLSDAVKALKCAYQIMEGKIISV